MFTMKNGSNNVILFLIQALTKVTDKLWPAGEIFFERILTNLYCTKNNEFNIFHSDAQKHVSYIRSHKKYLIHYGQSYGLGKGLLCFFKCVSLFVYATLNFNVLCDAYLL